MGRQAGTADLEDRAQNPNPTRDWDLRLVPAASLGWLTAWAAPLLSAGLLLGIALAAALACLSALLVGRSPRCAVSDRTGRRRTAALALALAGLGLIAGTSVSHIHARDTSPLRQLATGEADIRLLLRVTEAVRILAPGASGSRVLVPGNVLALTCGAPCADSAIRSWTLSGDVLVFAPAQGWAELVPGTTVSATVSIATAAPQDMLVGIAFARGPPEASAPPDGVLDSGAAEIRGGLRERADRTLDSDEAGLLRGIVLGDTAGMDAVLVEDFRISGLSHLTAVSGTNCAIVIGAVLWPLRRSRFRPVTRAVICALALAAFVVLVGPQPSVLRAAAMGAVTLLALATGRTRQAIPALAAAVLVLLSFDPALARDLGFALSVAATAGIIVAAGVWAQQLRARGVPEPLAVATSVCAAAGLFTAPLLVLIVGRVSLISLPANLLVVPVVAIVTVVGLAAALITPFSPWLGEVLLRLVDWPLRWMVWIAERAARTPGAVVPWPSGPAGALALATVIVVSVFVLRRRRVRWLAAAVCVGVAVSGLSIRVLAPAWPPAGWAMVACDVGQGDALVVGLGAGRAVVLDAGPDPVLVDGCLRRLGVDDVPMILLSHLHADHVDGLIGVLRGRTVGAIATSADPPPLEAYRRVRALAEQAGVPVVALRAGQTRMVDRARVEVLGPVARYVGTRSDPNNSSVVARISIGAVSMLATGDIEFEAQSDLLRREIDLTADVLKVAHHGSAYQDPAFLTATGASQALISVGAGNDYGHPDQVLVDRLRSAGTAVHRTDEHGDIAVLNGPGPDLTVVARGDPIRVAASTPGMDLPRADRTSRQRISRGPGRRLAWKRCSARLRGRGSGWRPGQRPVCPRSADTSVRPTGSAHRDLRQPAQPDAARRWRDGSADRPPGQLSARSGSGSRFRAPTAR